MMENSATNAFQAIGGVVAVILAIFLIVLAILWIVFPWFVYSKLNVIEKNTRASAQSLDAILATLNASHAVQVANEQNTRPRAVEVVRMDPPPIVK
jgi:hypothetical protein